MELKINRNAERTVVKAVCFLMLGFVLVAFLWYAGTVQTCPAPIAPAPAPGRTFEGLGG